MKTQCETYYQVLELSPTATEDEIKQSYRRLAKQYHPDLNRQGNNTDRIIKINAAYEILSDPRQRQRYDLQIDSSVKIPAQQQSQAKSPRRPRTVGKELDEDLVLWLNQVYTPVNRTITWIIKPLKSQIIELSADPFDDDLIGNFASYITDCQRHLDKIEKTFYSLSSPTPLAALATELYYCIGQIGDAIKEFNYYLSSYDDRYLHSGQEMFKIAANLQKNAQKIAKSYK
jgi:molecular chaperone DnaJ